MRMLCRLGLYNYLKEVKWVLGCNKRCSSLCRLKKERVVGLDDGKMEMEAFFDEIKDSTP